MIRSTLPVLLSFFSLFAMVSCKDAGRSSTATEKETVIFNLDSARKEIDQANMEFIDLFRKYDSVGVANMFTADGKSMEPNAPAFVGRKAIQTHYAMIMNAGANNLGLVTTGLWGDQNMLAEEGEFTFSDKDGKQLDKGKYIVLWKNEDGKWKLFRDCYNSDLPM